MTLITILISANQEEGPKFFIKLSQKMFFWKKYYPVPQIFPKIASTQKCFNRGHPNQYLKFSKRDDENSSKFLKNIFFCFLARNKSETHISI
jgi:hypothetical protein